MKIMKEYVAFIEKKHYKLAITYFETVDHSIKKQSFFRPWKESMKTWFMSVQVKSFYKVGRETGKKSKYSSISNAKIEKN